MHDTAFGLGKAFFEVYRSVLDVGVALRGRAALLDVGACSVNGSLRSMVPADLAHTYTGLDMAHGEGVDVVCASGESFPLDAGRFDVVVSTSAFEHDECFWLTVNEMFRVTRPGGAIYVNAPSKGKYHGYPLDCWRFYPDAAVALVNWGRRSGYDVSLLESFHVADHSEEWQDMVMIMGVGWKAPPRHHLATFLDGHLVNLMAEGLREAP